MKNWFLKIRNRVNGYQIAIYDDGTVYGKEKGYKILRLTASAVEQIRALVHEDLGMIKKYGYDVQSNGVFNAKFWDNSNHKRSLKIRGWYNAYEVLDVIFTSANEEARFIDSEEYGSLLDYLYDDYSE